MEGSARQAGQKDKNVGTKNKMAGTKNKEAGKQIKWMALAKLYSHHRVRDSNNVSEFMVYSFYRCNCKNIRDAKIPASEEAVKSRKRGSLGRPIVGRAGQYIRVHCWMVKTTVLLVDSVIGWRIDFCPIYINNYLIRQCQCF